MPCRFAEHAELEALCAVLGERGRMLQIVHEFFDPGLTVTRIEMLGELSRTYGIPTTLSPLFHSAAMRDGPAQVMEAVEREWAASAHGCGRRCRPGPSTSAGRSTSAASCSSSSPAGGRCSRSHEGGEAGRLRRPGRPRHRSSTASTCCRRCPARPSTPARSSCARSPWTATGTWSAAPSTTSPPSGDTTAAELLIDLAVEEDLGTWFIRSEIGHADAEGRRLAARPPVRARRSQRRRRPRRLVRDLRRHRLPLLPLRARDRGAAARGGRQEDHLRHRGHLGPPQPGSRARGLRRRSRPCSTPPRSTAGPRSRPTTSPATASGGSATRSAWTPSSWAAP